MDFDEVDRGYLSDPSVAPMDPIRERVRSSKRRRIIYYSSEGDEEEDIDLDFHHNKPRRRRRGKKRNFDQLRDDEEYVPYFRPKRKKRRKSKRNRNGNDPLFNTKHNNVLKQLSRHYPDISNLIREAKTVQCSVTPQLETVSDFEDLEKFHSEIQRSHSQLCELKRKFQECHRELSSKIQGDDVKKEEYRLQRHHASTALQECEGSIYGINQKIQSITQKIDRLQREQQQAIDAISDIQSLADDQNQRIQRNNEMITRLKEEQIEAVEARNVMERIYPVIDALERECDRTRVDIEKKDIELRRSFENWNTETVISWFRTLTECTFNRNTTKNTPSDFYDDLRRNEVSGLELNGMNPVFLKFMGVTVGKDQQAVMREIGKLKELKNEREWTEEISNRCVVCRDAMADMVAIPCGHHCVCNKCFREIAPKEEEGECNAMRCPFCGKECQIYKTYSDLV